MCMLGRTMCLIAVPYEARRSSLRNCRWRTQAMPIVSCHVLTIRPRFSSSTSSRFPTLRHELSIQGRSTARSRTSQGRRPPKRTSPISSTPSQATTAAKVLMQQQLQVLFRFQGRRHDRVHSRGLVCFCQCLLCFHSVRRVSASGRWCVRLSIARLCIISMSFLS